jgi:hypothetical protein
MPATHTFHLQHKLSNNLEIVYNSLLDLKKFGGIHPHITDVNIITDNSPHFIEYDIVEDIQLMGFIRNHPRYTAKVFEIEKNRHIRYLSPVKTFIFLQVDFIFSVKNGLLVVDETFQLTCNKFWALVFTSILKKAHLRFFANLKSLLQTSVEEINV